MEPQKVIRVQTRYKLWHILNGGSGYKDEPFFDFPGECSIQKMIEKLPD